MNYGTPISSKNIPQNVIALDLDDDEHYVLTPKPVLRATPTLFELKQFQPSISPNIFTAQEAGDFSNVEITKFGNRVTFTKCSDNLLKFSGEAILCDFVAIPEKHPIGFYSTPNRNLFILYNVLRSVHLIIF